MFTLPEACIVSCYFIPETRVQNALNDVASDICPALVGGVG